MQIVTVSPTLSLTAYAAGDLMGDKNTLTNFLPGSESGTLRGVVVIDAAKQNAALDVVFFSADPAGTTFTDNGAFAPVAADVANAIGHVSIVAGDYSAFSANSVATKAGLALALGGAQTLYAALVSRGTPTYVAATDLTVKLIVDN